MVALIAVVLIAEIGILIYTLLQNTNVMRQIRDNIELDTPSSEPERFSGEKAERLFEKGDIKQLQSYCEGFIKKSPNNVNANWYFAIAHYNKGDYRVAREYFEQVIRINPLWREGAIVYLQEIAEKIGLPNHNRLLH